MDRGEIREKLLEEVMGGYITKETMGDLLKVYGGYRQDMLSAAPEHVKPGMKKVWDLVDSISDVVGSLDGIKMTDPPLYEYILHMLVCIIQCCTNSDVIRKMTTLCMAVSVAAVSGEGEEPGEGTIQ